MPLSSQDAKEYVTPEKLEREILDEITVGGGRVHITSIQPALNVDLRYIQDKANNSSSSSPSIHTYKQTNKHMHMHTHRSIKTGIYASISSATSCSVHSFNKLQCALIHPPKQTAPPQNKQHLNPKQTAPPQNRNHQTLTLAPTPLTQSVKKSNKSNRSD